MKKITMVTGNIGKWEIAKKIFEKYDIELKQAKQETPEIQSYDVEDVSKFSALYSAKELGCSVIKSDVGYYINSLNGFPGVFVKYINGMLKSEHILNMLKDGDDRTIFLKECLTFATPTGKFKQFVNIEKAKIAKEACGEGSTFDKIIIFEGDDKPKSLNSNEENMKHFEKQLKIYDEMAKYLMEEVNE